MKAFFGIQLTDLLVGASALGTLHALTKQKNWVFLAAWTGVHVVSSQGGALLALTMVSFVFPKRDVYAERAVEAEAAVCGSAFHEPLIEIQMIN